MMIKQFWKFLFKFFAFISILVVLDLLFGLLCSKLLSKQTDGRFYKIAYSIDKSTDDVIIIGSSRAETNYNPAVFSKKLGMSCWNAGRGGQGIAYFLALEKEMLKRYSPKIIILNMDPNSLEGPVDYDKLAILRPYSKNHSIIYELLIKKDWSEKYKLLSNVYIYNSMAFYFIRPFFVKNKDGKQSDRGWKPKTGEIPALLTSSSKKYANDEQGNELNSEKISMFNQMVENLNRDNTKLIVSFSPDYFSNQTETKTMTYLKKLSSEGTFGYFNFTRDSALVEKQKYFCDPAHMNDLGANEFSGLLADTLHHLFIKTYAIKK